MGYLYRHIAIQFYCCLTCLGVKASVWLFLGVCIHSLMSVRLSFLPLSISRNKHLLYIHLLLAIVGDIKEAEN